jgi:predicted nucleotidyltransferase
MKADLEKLKGEVVDILRKHDICRAVFFGASATGEQREGSDIDILIEFKGGEMR